jgi:hypothetical protein
MRLVSWRVSELVTKGATERALTKLPIRQLAKRLVFVFLAVLSLLHSASAQTRFTYTSGQTVSPAYEGWWPNEDGSFTCSSAT